MNWVDATILIVLALSALFGLLRGLVREVLGLLAWVGAAAAAAYFFPESQALARRAITDTDVADPVAFGAVFLVVLIALSLMARAAGGGVQRSALSGLDRTLGLVWGAARGAALIIAAYVLLGIYQPASDLWPPEVVEARSLPTIYRGAEWAVQRLPEQYRPFLPMPPPNQRARAVEWVRPRCDGACDAPARGIADAARAV